MTRKKKLSVVLFAVLLCFILAFGLAACVDDTDNDKTHNETVQPYITEVSKALANSISADLANGFYAGYAGSVKIGNDEYTFDLDANILSKAKEGQEAANNNFRLVVKQGDAVLFGLYNDKTNLYLEQGENKYNFANASVMKALRSVLTLNVPGFSELTNLDKIEVMDADLDYFIESTMPLIITILCEDPAKDADSNLMVEKNDDTYTLTMDLSNISSLGGLLGVGDLDLSFLSGIQVKLDLKVANEAVKKIDVSLKVGETAYAVSVTSKSDGGLFGAVKDDLDAQVPEALKAVAESSVIQTNFAGKIKVNVKDGVLKTLDWKLVSKIDLFDLVDKNFVFSELADGNFFHFQLSHKCDASCEEYCAANLVSATSSVLGERFKNTSIVDIAWDPSKLETNNIFVDISLWDLLTNNGLEQLLSSAAGMEIPGISQMASMMISSQIVLSVDPDTVLLADNTVARTQEGSGDSEEEGNASAGLNVDIMKVLSSITGLGGISGNALNVNIDGIKNLVSAIAGEAPIVGDLTIATALDYVFDTANGVTGFSFTIDDNSFGHNANVLGYDTYKYAVRENANGKLKLATYGEDQTTPYGGKDFGNVSVKGSPALTTKEVTMTNGFLNIYEKNSEGKYILVADDKKVLTNYDVEVVYGGLKNLYFEYTYLDFNKAPKKAYGSIFGFNGLNLNITGAQEVKLLASPMTGESITTTIEKNLTSLLSAVGVTLDFDLNLEKLIPIVAQTFPVKVNFDAAYAPENVQFVKDETSEYKNTYQIGEEINNKAHVEFNVGAKRYSYAMTASDNIVKDVFGQNKSGDYVVTYSIDSNLKIVFPNGTNAVKENVTIERFKKIAFVKNDELVITEEDNSGIKDKEIGTVVYTLNDNSEDKVPVVWKNVYNNVFFLSNDGDVLLKEENNLSFTKSGTYTANVRYDEVVVLSWEISVIGIDKVEASANSSLTLYEGDNAATQQKLGTLTVKYKNGTSKTIDYAWGDYDKFTIVDENGVADNAKFTNGNLYFAHPGKFTFKVTYGGTEYQFEYTVVAIESIEQVNNTNLLVIAGRNAISGLASYDWWFINFTVKYADNTTKTIQNLWMEKMDSYVVTNKETGDKNGITKLATNELVFSKAGVYTFAIVFSGKEYTFDVTVYSAPEITYEKNAALVPARVGTTGSVALSGKVLVSKFTQYGEDYGSKKVTEEVKFAMYMTSYFTVTKDGKTSGSVNSDGVLKFNSAGTHTVTFTYDSTEFTWTVEVVAPISAETTLKSYNNVFTVGVAVDCNDDVLYSVNNVYEDTSLNESISVTFYNVAVAGSLQILDGEMWFMIPAGADKVTVEMGKYFANTKITFKKAGTYAFAFTAGGKSQMIEFTVAAATPQA